MLSLSKTASSRKWQKIQTVVMRLNWTIVFLDNETNRDSKMEGILIEKLVVLAGHQSCLFLMVILKKHLSSGFPLSPKVPKKGGSKSFVLLFPPSRFL